MTRYIDDIKGMLVLIIRRAFHVSYYRQSTSSQVLYLRRRSGISTLPRQDLTDPPTVRYLDSLYMRMGLLEYDELGKCAWFVFLVLAGMEPWKVEREIRILKQERNCGQYRCLLDTTFLISLIQENKIDNEKYHTCPARVYVSPSSRCRTHPSSATLLHRRLNKTLKF